MDNKERIIHYRFTAYLMKSIKAYKTKYIRRKKLRHRIETLVYDFNDLIYECPEDYTDIGQQLNNLHNTALEKSLVKLKTRDINIFMLHLLEDYSLKEISLLLDINYNTVLSIYTRTIKKIKNDMGDDIHEF